MNIVELIVLAFALWRRRAGRYLVAGLAFMLAATVVFGWAAGIFLIDMLIALSAGGEYGHWVKSPPHLAMMIAATAGGLSLISFFLFSLWGGFLNMCTRIGAGAADVGILDFLGYGISRARTFWGIGFMQIIVTVVLSLPGIAFVQLGGNWEIAGFVFIALGAYVASLPFAMAFPAAVEEGRGPIKSVLYGMTAVLSKPFAAAVLVALVTILDIAGIVLLPLYPLYYFLFAAPLSALLLMAYYQKARAHAGLGKK